MKIKRWLGIMIATVWLSGSAVCAQQTSYQPPYPPPSPIDEGGMLARPKDAIVPAGGGLSDWITNRRDCCEGKPGIITPLYTEVYLNAGPSIPVGGMTLSRELKTGWSITGGARAAFFNEPQTRAWVVDLHLINTNETGGRQNTQFPVTFFQNGTRSDLIPFQGAIGRTTFSVQKANRTLAGVGLGREWYLWRPATSEGCTWRFGIDGGGRWGSQRVSFNEFGHITDTVTSVYAAAHTELEFPCGSCLIHAGLRLECAYIWSDVLQRPSDSQDISLLVTMGIRF